MRALLDTCIIIDAMQNRKPFSYDAQKIFLYAANNSFIGFITAKESTDIYYLMHHYTKSEKGSRDILNKLFTIFEVLDTSGTDCINAISSACNDYEDAVMIETAKRFGIDCIITRNIKDYLSSGVKVYTPEQFISIIDNENI